MLPRRRSDGPEKEPRTAGSELSDRQEASGRTTPSLDRCRRSRVHRRRRRGAGPGQRYRLSSVGHRAVRGHADLDALPHRRRGAAAGVAVRHRRPADGLRPTRRRQVHIAVARVPATDQANRIGSLFFNFGGPGGPAVDFLQASAPASSPRSTSASTSSASTRGASGRARRRSTARSNQESSGIYSQPVPTPQTSTCDAYCARTQSYVHALPARTTARSSRHVSTANVARDMDALRAAVGDAKLNYLGFSYGTFLGATYAALFPTTTGRWCSTARSTPSEYINDPIDGPRRADRRLRARAPPLPRGLRGRPGRVLRLRRRRPATATTR